ncbi:tumor necrosis factor receptor superfamily member 10D-like isoform X1 [Pongo abelii]|uniref:tumor necrosis factor receptor superfamily member 10D-like isoform X1 n=1 Tax=Pongo abelii TaxID=9601 RepID=UPI003004871C
MGAPVQRYLAARTASGTRPWLSGPKTLKFVVLIIAVLLLVYVYSATIPRQDEAPQQTVAPQQQRRSLKEEECPAGSHRSEHTGACNPCNEGVDYTNDSNNLFSCFPCTVCKSEQKEMSPCTTTRNTVCQCEPGSFRNNNSIEMCRKCRTECPKGMVKVSDCTPWSDINCSASAASSTGKTPAAEETVTTSLGTLASPCCLTAIITGILVSILVAGGLVYILPWKKLISYLKGICSGAGGGPERVHRVSWFLQNLGALWVQELLPVHCHAWVSEQEIQGQELAEPTGVTVESPEEPQHLLEQAEAEGCQRRRLLVPVNDADSADISTFLDASATPEEGHAKETIQDQLVGSEKLFYEEDDAGSATSCL